jgi:Flp pilus assembly protein TadG
MPATLHHRQLHGLRARLAEQSGAALVEFALVLPVLLLILLGTVDLGKAYNYWIDETHLANEAARYAAVDQNPDPITHPGDFLAAIRAQADTGELRDGGTSAVPDALEVCVHMPQGATVGKPVTVTVTSRYRFLSFLISRFKTVTERPMVTSSTMRLERVPTDYSDGECA